MITRAESMTHLAAAAALSTAMLAVGFGALGLTRRVRARPRAAWIVGGLLGVGLTCFVANLELPFAAGGLMAAGAGAIAGLGVATPLALVGLRGRYVGDHPHCGRCAFDLTGRPADAAKVCPECGVALDARGAVTTGVRRRQPVPLTIGAFVAILSLAVGTVVARQAIANVDGRSWQKLKPTSWLLNDLVKGRLADQSAAANELGRRLGAGELDDADVERFVAAGANAPPGSPAALYRVAAAQHAWPRGQLSEATMRAILRELAQAQAFAVAPESSPTRVPYKLTFPKLVAAPVPDFSIVVRDRVDTIGDATVPPAAIVGAAWPGEAIDARGGHYPFQTRTSFGRLYRLANDVAVPAGPAVVRVRATVDVTYAPVRGPALTEPVPVDVHATTTIVPGLERPLPSLGPVAPKLSAGHRVVRAPDGTVLIVTLYARGGGLPFVGDVVVRDAAGAERTIGELVLEDSQARTEIDLPRPADDSTLLLRPRPERGVELLRSFPTYQHEIVLGPVREADAGIYRRVGRARPPATRATGE